MTETANGGRIWSSVKDSDDYSTIRVRKLLPPFTVSHEGGEFHYCNDLHVSSIVKLRLQWFLLGRWAYDCTYIGKTKNTNTLAIVEIIICTHNIYANITGLANMNIFPSHMAEYNDINSQNVLIIITDLVILYKNNNSS